MRVLAFYYVAANYKYIIWLLMWNHIKKISVEESSYWLLVFGWIERELVMKATASWRAAFYSFHKLFATTVESQQYTLWVKCIKFLDCEGSFSNNIFSCHSSFPFCVGWLEYPTKVCSYIVIFSHKVFSVKYHSHTWKRGSLYSLPLYIVTFSRVRYQITRECQQKKYFCPKNSRVFCWGEERIPKGIIFSKRFRGKVLKLNWKNKRLGR